MDSRGEIDTTIGRYESYVRADPGNALLWLNLGDLYHRVSRFDEAIACFERCLNDHPEYVSARSRLASVMISQHRFAEAEKVLRPLLESEPADANLMFNLGLALYYQERWSEAERCFSDAIDAGQRLPDAHAYLARCQHRAGNMPDAIASCQRWLDSARDSESRGYLALLHMDHGDIAEAHRLALEALRHDPNNTDAGIVAGTASIEAQEMAAAGEQFGRILAREPDNARAWLGMGLVRLYEQRFADSIAALQRASELLPQASGILVTLGWAKLASRELAGAEQVFRRAVEVDRNFAEAHGGLASALALQSRADEASRAIARARRLNRDGFGAVFAQTVLLKLQGQEKQAVDLLANMLQQVPREGGQSLIEQIRIYAGRNPFPSPPAPKGPSNEPPRAR
jgi:tetratricopeptide (TPR) repeat protein